MYSVVVLGEDGTDTRCAAASPGGACELGAWRRGDVADVARPERWDGLAVAAGGAVAGPEQDDGAVHRVEHPPAGLVQ